MITGIIVALPEELGTLTSAKVIKGHYCRLTDNILIAYAGAGPENARKASELLIKQGVTQLISWGCAAALSPALKPGDLLLPQSLLTEKGQKLSCDPNWVEYTRHTLESSISVHSGNLSESSTIVAESNHKRTMFSQTGAVALDMESCAIAKAALQANISFLVIRTIADPVNMNLPKAVSQAMNVEGELELPRLLHYILLHPLEIPGLIKLGIHFNAAKNTLKSIAKYLDQIIAFDHNIPEQ